MKTFTNSLFRLSLICFTLVLACCKKNDLASQAEALMVKPSGNTGTPTIPVTSGTTMNNLLCVNAFEWDFLNPASPEVIDETKMNLIKGFGGIRHYLDWQRIEPKEGSFTFNPSHYGGWNYDIIYQRSKQEGLLMLADIKTVPEWMLETYPADMRDYEVIPMPYNSPRDQPSSYIKQAKAGFQFAARYGSNPNVNLELLKVYQQQRWTADPINQVKVGMSVISYIECDNERDKWWKGTKAQQTPEEYAANLSAFYDGHKGTLGADVGVKTADPKMKVVMAGLAHPDVEYVKKMVEWCRVNRGMKDGKVDLCFDVINYHQYSNDAGVSMTAWPTKGVAPETGSLATVATDFVNFAKTISPDMEVWVTETGYDINQGSIQKAIPIKTKSAAITQADWNLRTALLYARKGISKVFFYMLDDVSTESTTQYSSSGFVEGTQRRASANYFLQVKNLMGNYKYVQTVNSDPLVDVYSLDAQKIYALVMPTEIGKEAIYKLKIENASKATVYTLDPASSTIKSKVVNLTNGTLSLTVTETPTFVKPVL